MRFRTDVNRAEIPELLDRMVQITGGDPWAKRFEWLLRESAENPVMGEWLDDRFSMEQALWRALTAESEQILQGGRLNQGAYELAAFAAGLVSLYEGSTDHARKRLRGQLLDGLKSDSGLLGLQLEISTVAHLVRAGCDVHAHDLEAGGGFDFLVTRDGKEVEVECKLASADIGRKIHRRQAAKLFHSVSVAVGAAFASATGGLLVLVTLPDRLTPALAQHDAIVDAVRLALLGTTEHREACTVQLHRFDIARSPFAAGLDGHDIAPGGALRRHNAEQLAHDLHAHLQGLPVLALHQERLAVAPQHDVDAAIGLSSAAFFDLEAL